MARFLLSMTTRFYSSTSSLHFKPNYRQVFGTFSSSMINYKNNPGLFFTRPSLGYRYLSKFPRMHELDNNNRRNFVAYNGVPAAPLPSPPPSSSLRNWIIGIVLTIVLPFVTNKWGPLLKLKNEVDTVVETIEQITEVVEQAAEVVDKVAEDISDHLPEGGKLKKTVDLIENVAEQTAKDAHLVGDIIDKVQEVEEDVESIVESFDGDKAKEPSKEIKDEK